MIMQIHNTNKNKNGGKKKLTCDSWSVNTATISIIVLSPKPFSGSCLKGNVSDKRKSLSVFCV